MRLKDADALIEKMFKEADAYANDDVRKGYHNCECLVYDAPTIDAEPVTRCADCIDGLKYHGEILCIQEYWKGYLRRPEDFCSRAIPARKEENE